MPLLFSLFPWTEGVSRKLLGHVLGPVLSVVLSVVYYVPNLLTILVIYFFTTYSVRFLRFLAGEVAAGKLVIDGFYPDWALPTFNLLHQHIQDAFARAGVEIMSPPYRATRTGADAGSTIPPAPLAAPAAQP